MKDQGGFAQVPKPEMHFRDQGHKAHYKRYLTLLRPTDAHGMSACLALAAIDREPIKDYIGRPEPGCIDFCAMKRGVKHLSDGEQGLRDLAAALFGAYPVDDFDHVFGSLDEDNFGVALEALIHRYQWPYTVGRHWTSYVYPGVWQYGSGRRD
ncbi:MAG: hypothetical protein ACM3WU_04230 [Bacillota bacterium]